MSNPVSLRGIDPDMPSYSSPEGVTLVLGLEEEITEKDAARIVDVRALEMMYHTRPIRATLVHVAKLPKLQELNLMGCEVLTNRDVRILSDLRALCVLDISSCLGLTNSALYFIAKLRTLRTLDASSTYLPTKALPTSQTIPSCAS